MRKNSRPDISGSFCNYTPDQPALRLDKTAFKIQTFEEADDHYGYWKDKTHKERLDAAFYLICQAFQVTPATKLDRTVFSKRKHS